MFTYLEIVINARRSVVVNLCTGSFGSETAALPFVCFESLSSEIEFILILTLSFKQ